MSVFDLLKNLWHIVKPLLNTLLPVAACVVFALLNNRNKWVKAGSRMVLILIFAYSAFYLCETIIQSIRVPVVWDFTAFYLYGKVAAAGQNFYLPENFQHVFYTLHLPPLDYSEFIRESVNVGFFYLPPTIFLFLPLGFLSYQTALICWILFILLFALACVYLVQHLFFESGQAYGLLFVASLFFLFPPVKSTFYFAQTSFILLFLLLLMKKYEDKKIAGLFLALAFFVKPYMIVFGLIFLIRKKWKAIIYAVGSSLVICLLTVLAFGISPFESYLFENAAKRLPAAAFSENINQSLQAVLLRHHLISLGSLVYPVLAASVLLLTTVFLIHLYRKGQNDLMWIILLLAVLILYPGTLSHYGVMILYVIYYWLTGTGLTMKKIGIILLVGALYYFALNFLFITLCLLLGIAIGSSFYLPRYSRINLNT